MFGERTQSYNKQDKQYQCDKIILTTDNKHKQHQM